MIELLDTNNTNTDTNTDIATVECAICHRTMDADDAIHVQMTAWETMRHGSVYLCDDCAHDDAALEAARLHKCDHCGAVCSENALHRTWVDSTTYEWWCDDCLDAEPYTTTCDDCDDYMLEDAVTYMDMYDGDTRTVCPDCAHNYQTCDDCGRDVADDDADYDTRDGWTLCPDCAERYAGERKLKCYGHTTASVFLDTWRRPYAYDGHVRALDMRAHSEKLYIGIELETCAACDDGDDAEELAEKVCDAADAIRENVVECKEDSSLGDGGCEIVSQPATPIWHIESGLWESITRVCREAGATSHDAKCCGLHMHVSRDFFRDDSGCSIIGAACFYLDAILSTHRDLTYAITRRTSQSLREWARLQDFPDGVLSAYHKVSAGGEKTSLGWWEDNRDYTRYRAINMQPYSTIEFRAPRGTLKLTTFYATLEMWAGMCALAKFLATTRDAYQNPYRVWEWSDARMMYAIMAACADYGIPTSHLAQYARERGVSLSEPTTHALNDAAIATDAAAAL